MGMFRDAQDVYDCIGGVFEEAIADPEIGTKTKEAGLTIRFDFKEPESTIYVDFGGDETGEDVVGRFRPAPVRQRRRLGVEADQRLHQQREAVPTLEHVGVVPPHHVVGQAGDPLPVLLRHPHHLRERRRWQRLRHHLDEVALGPLEHVVDQPLRPGGDLVFESPHPAG